MRQETYKLQQRDIDFIERAAIAIYAADSASATTPANYQEAWQAAFDLWKAGWQMRELESISFSGSFVTETVEEMVLSEIHNTKQRE